ncbi:MAG: methylenetetrahydrofolate reductase [NAD(P)H] [Deferribacteraceae bacterium]|jgi:methylenetetrahydrofolate reductase (NADPH)|nr:methylenetetrahydrofolate reductase [NAD(P)H] [Deferribacteraceae bacterium]
MRIDKLLKNKKTVSFEFFPPKEAAQESVLFDTINKLAPLNPDFVSITYGAGGSVAHKTFDWTLKLKDEYKFNSMMHITCYGNNADSLRDICGRIYESGIDNLLALRGDPPKEEGQLLKNNYSYAEELVKFISDNYPGLCIGVAGYPEKHIHAASMKADIENAKRKIDAGGSFIITQLFFDNAFFYRYRDMLAQTGINVPVLAGIMPIVNYKQIIRFTQMCGSTLPPSLVEKFEKATDSDAVKIGEEYAFIQSQDLFAQGADGIHYYTLNRYSSVLNILKRTF